MVQPAVGYGSLLRTLVEDAGFSQAPPDRVVDLIIEWLEAEDDSPFGETWLDGLQEWGFVWNAGDLRPDAVAMVGTSVRLLHALSGRRLAWMLAELDADAAFLRPFFGGLEGSTQRARAVSVRDELERGAAQATRALKDDDPRSRGYGASLLANLSHFQVGLLERAPIAHALERETEPVVRATLRLALDTSTDDHVLDPGEEAIVAELEARGKVGPVWGGRPDVPMILGNAVAKVHAASRQMGRSLGLELE